MLDLHLELCVDVQGYLISNSLYSLLWILVKLYLPHPKLFSISFPSTVACQGRYAHEFAIETGLLDTSHAIRASIHLKASDWLISTLFWVIEVALNLAYSAYLPIAQYELFFAKNILYNIIIDLILPSIANLFLISILFGLLMTPDFLPL